MSCNDREWLFKDVCVLGDCEALPPCQETMIDLLSDYSGCWADTYDEDHEEMRVREANSEPRVGA